MGYWDNSLYSNDLALDIKDDYTALLENNQDDVASKKIVQMYEPLLKTDEESLFWYVLADAQWELGRLNKMVREKAICFINSENPCPFIDDKKQLNQWKKVLVELEKKINSLQPAKKALIKEKEFVTNPWLVGDIYAYRIHNSASKTSQQYIVIQKIGDDIGVNGLIASRIQIYNKVFSAVPDINELKDFNILPLDIPERFFANETDNKSNYILDMPLIQNAVIEIFKEQDYPNDYLVFIENSSFNEDAYLPNVHLSSLFWRDIESVFYDFYSMWKNYNYYFENERLIVSKK
jgi:hypothetical protein